jgi:Leucine-rich repeat (LRR) protein
MNVDSPDARLIAKLAAGRSIVDLSHPRARTDGVIAVQWSATATAIRICAHRCHLTHLPDDLSTLTQLERLDVGGNHLTHLPTLPPSLRELYVDDNQLPHLSPLPPLTVLDANRNHLTHLPPLTDLAFAYLAENRLTTLPALRNVRYLNVSDNPLATLALSADAGVRELRAERIQLRALALDGLTELRELALRGNQLTQLPDAIATLAHLRILDLRGNRLDDLPSALRALPLAKLDLRWNPLRMRPAWLDELATGCLVHV